MQGLDGRRHGAIRRGLGLAMALVVGVISAPAMAQPEEPPVEAYVRQATNLFVTCQMEMFRALLRERDAVACGDHAIPFADPFYQAALDAADGDQALVGALGDFKAYWLESLDVMMPVPEDDIYSQSDRSKARYEGITENAESVYQLLE